MKRLTLTASKLIMALAFITCDGPENSTKEAPKPNVIIILTDQWRASSLGYNGNDQVKTPQLDSFAMEAVNFRNAVSVTPVCTPFRASMLTGKYPTSTGMFLNDLYLPAEELTMAEIYKEEGYATGYIGKWHLDGHGRYKFVAPERRQGFDYWKASECDHDHNKEHFYLNSDTTKRFWEGYSPFSMAASANEFIEERSKAEEPFLLVVSMTTPHFPHETALERYTDMYPADSLVLPYNVPEEKQEWARKELQGYYAHCTATDVAVGQIIDKIQDIGIFDSSIILFTSDHGEMMGAHGYRPWMKHQPYNESSNVPFLVSYPAKMTSKGATAEAPITTPDILPTLLSLSGITIPNCVEGYDLSGIVEDPTSGTERGALFMNICPFGMAFPDDEYRALKTANYTYVKTPAGSSMLFNDPVDPLQMHNLIDNPKMQEVKDKLDSELQAELARIGEDEIKPRTFYTTKFGYEGREQINTNYNTLHFYEVEDPNTPKHLKPICAN